MLRFSDILASPLATRQDDASAPSVCQTAFFETIVSFLPRRLSARDPARDRADDARRFRDGDDNHPSPREDDARDENHCSNKK
jgi:hypothetical protein